MYIDLRGSGTFDGKLQLSQMDTSYLNMLTMSLIISLNLNLAMSLFKLQKSANRLPVENDCHQFKSIIKYLDIQSL